MITVQQLTKKYSAGRPPAVDAISFEVKDGETVGFVGLNGAGKTTTIKVAVGAHLPTSGTVAVDGYDIVNDKIKACMAMGWVPEFPNFDQGAKAWSLMRYYAGFYKGQYNTAARCTEVLKSVGLSGAEGKKLREYSQGMKKRFSLGISLLSNPHNLVFDEVLNGLDPEGIAYFRQLVLDYKKEGRAILFSSHLLSEIEALADKIVFIHKGKILKVVRRSDIAVASKDSLRIVVDNLDQKAISFLNTLGQATVQNNTVTMYDLKAKPSVVNSELAKMGYAVSELIRVSSSLEDYFFRIIGEQGAPTPTAGAS